MAYIKEYLEQVRSLERSAFVAENPAAFLVHPSGPDSLHPREEYCSTLEMKVDQQRQEVRIEPQPPALSDIVIPLEKTDANSFAGKILVGRTETNDLLISHLTVSKHHAFFNIGQPDTLTDAGSTNGTTLNGRHLGAKTPNQITDGDRISFGDVQYTYFTPGGLYDLLSSLSALH